MNENLCSNQEIHVLFEHGSELENTYNEPCTIRMTLLRQALRTRLIISPMFLFAKTLRTVKTLWRRNDVRKVTADAILFREIQCKKMDNLMFKQRFQCELGWNKVKYARITITHVCLIALTLAGSLRCCWTLALSASCSNSILGTRQILVHEKTCVIPIFLHFFISSKYDFHVDADRMTATSWEMSRIICVDLKKKKIFRDPIPLLR